MSGLRFADRSNSYQSYGSHCHRITRDESHKGSLRVDYYDEKRNASKEDLDGFQGTSTIFLLSPIDLLLVAVRIDRLIPSGAHCPCVYCVCGTVRLWETERE